MRFMIATVCIVPAGVIAGGIWAQHHQSGDMIVAAEMTLAGNTASWNCLSCHLSNPGSSANGGGLGMQVFTSEFADSTLRPVNPPIQVGDTTYAVELDEYGGSLVGHRPGGSVKYAIQYAVGVKQIYYFLTTLPDGRLQILPLAFDLQMRHWLPTGADLPLPETEPVGPGESGRNRLRSPKGACEECHQIAATAHWP